MMDWPTPLAFPQTAATTNVPATVARTTSSSAVTGGINITSQAGGTTTGDATAKIASRLVSSQILGRHG